MLESSVDLSDRQLLYLSGEARSSRSKATNCCSEHDCSSDVTWSSYDRCLWLMRRSSKKSEKVRKHEVDRSLLWTIADCAIDDDGPRSVASICLCTSGLEVSVCLIRPNTSPIWDQRILDSTSLTPKNLHLDIQTIPAHQTRSISCFAHFPEFHQAT